MCSMKRPACRQILYRLYLIPSRHASVPVILLQQLGRARPTAIGTAHRPLREQVNRIGDEDLQRSSTRHVAANREIVREWEQGNTRRGGV